MATHECPEGYTPIRHHNTANFLLENIRDEHGEYWNPLETAAERCDTQDTCDGLLVERNRGLMRRQIAVDTTFTHNPSGRYNWCVRDAMIERKDDTTITTVPKRLNAFERGMKSVMNGTMCDGDTTEWKNGKCRSTVELETACTGGDLTYDASTGTCVPTPDICGALTMDPTTGRCVANESVCDDATTAFENGACVSTIDVTADNARVCDGTNLTVDATTGRCVVDATAVCGSRTRYNPGTDQCEREGGGPCTIM